MKGGDQSLKYQFQKALCHVKVDEILEEKNEIRYSITMHSYLGCIRKVEIYYIEKCKYEARCCS